MFDHFNLLAPIYDKVIQPKPPTRLTQILDLNPEVILLDVGGGTGRISQFYSKVVNQVIIADTSFKMLQKAQDKKHLAGVNAASELLPFKSDMFDRVLMVDALHHVIDQSISARELWRVLKPGGIIVIEEPNINKNAVKLVALAEKITLMRSHFLSGEKIQNLFSTFTDQTEIEKEDHYVWVKITKE